MKKLFLLAGILVLFNDVLLSQTTVHGVTLPEKLGKEGKLFVLNGAGVRSKYFMNVYVAGLFLHDKSSDAETILNNNEPIAIRIQIISALITQERMTESIKEGFQKSTAGNVAPIQKEIDMIIKVFNSEPIKIGDVFDIWYTPEKGIMASKNNKVLDIQIPGQNFKKYFFAIWLGKDPVEPALKSKLLGK